MTYNDKGSYESSPPCRNMTWLLSKVSRISALHVSSIVLHTVHISKVSSRLECTVWMTVELTFDRVDFLCLATKMFLKNSADDESDFWEFVQLTLENLCLARQNFSKVSSRLECTVCMTIELTFEKFVPCEKNISQNFSSRRICPGSFLRAGFRPWIHPGVWFVPLALH